MRLGTAAITRRQMRWGVRRQHTSGPSLSRSEIWSRQWKLLSGERGGGWGGQKLWRGVQ